MILFIMIRFLCQSSTKGSKFTETYKIASGTVNSIIKLNKDDTNLIQAMAII